MKILNPACLFLLCLLTSPVLFATNVFRITDLSERYIAEIETLCENSECKGPAEVRLFLKEDGSLFQTFRSPQLQIYFRDGQIPPNGSELQNVNTGLGFVDFNFDGYEDLAIGTGYGAAYGSPSYDIYVYNITLRQFVKSEDLTELAVSNMTMDVDSARKRLVTFNKSGCCFHISEEYEVIPQKGLKKVSEHSIGLQANGEKVEIITRELRNGKWDESIRIEEASRYYDED